MSNWLEPVGPHAPRVYWRRRALALALALGLLWVAARSCGADAGPKLPTGTGAVAPVATSTRTPPPPTFPASLLPTTAVPSASGAQRPATPRKTTPAVPAVCAKNAVQVTVRVDARWYDAKRPPKFTLTVTNISRLACRVDVGPKALSLLIVSGKDRIWALDDCQRSTRSEFRLLKPRQAAAVTVGWNRHRSRPGCPKAMAAARPGTYVIGGAVNGVEPARKAVFELR
jgi:hypothetical protein